MLFHRLFHSFLILTLTHHRKLGYDRHRWLDIASRALLCVGLFPVATTRHAISRSVITPIGFKFSTVSTMAISPQSCLTIISAACCTVCSGVQQARLAIIMSLSSTEWRNIANSLIWFRISNACGAQGFTWTPQALWQTVPAREPNWAVAAIHMQ